MKNTELAKNKVIANITVDDSDITITFTDGSVLEGSDYGQVCCEHRYMTCDEPLDHYVDSTFIGSEIRDGEYSDDDTHDDYNNVHEVEFLYVHTSVGSFYVVNHNEHNGYYGGFNIKWKFFPKR